MDAKSPVPLLPANEAVESDHLYLTGPAVLHFPRGSISLKAGQSADLTGVRFAAARPPRGGPVADIASFEIDFGMVLKTENTVRT